jgi:hypothetical protein
VLPAHFHLVCGPLPARRGLAADCPRSDPVLPYPTPLGCGPPRRSPGGLGRVDGGRPRNSKVSPAPWGADLQCQAFVFSRGGLPLAGLQRLQQASGTDHCSKETLLRLLLPLNDQVWITFRLWVVVADLLEPVRKPHLAIQSVVATGGVYKGQGRNQRMLMTCAY